MTARSEGSEPVGSLGEEAARLLAALQDRTGHGEHAAADGDCRYCPLCRAIGVVRATPPEVREHLTAAATSLAQAVSALLATAVPDDSGRPDGDGTRPDDRRTD